MKLGFYGYGEASNVFASELAAAGSAVERLAYDKFASDRTRSLAAQSGTRLMEDVRALTTECDVILSLVTGSAALGAAREIAPLIREDALYIDCNSISPNVKREIAAVFEANGRSIVDCAVMGSVPENGLRVSMLLSGKRARQASEALNALGCRAQVIGEEAGDAAAIKMVRSVFAKGLEALFMEMLLAGRRYGVQEQVIRSVCASIENKPLREVMNTLVRSEVRHAKRKKSEMQYVMRVLEDAGIPPIMSAATRESYDWLVSLDAPSRIDCERLDYLQIVAAIDAMLRAAGRIEEK